MPGDDEVFVSDTEHALGCMPKSAFQNCHAKNGEFYKGKCHDKSKIVDVKWRAAYTQYVAARNDLELQLRTEEARVRQGAEARSGQHA